METQAMSVLSDSEIRKLCLEHGMITPFSEGVYQDDIISFGLSSAGYDIRLGNKYKVFKNTSCVAVDPKRFKKDAYYASRVFDEFEDYPHDPITIPPHGYILGVSCESFKIPRNIVGTCIGKSTFCRCGIIVNVSPLEPQWEGQLVIEISNSNPCPAIVYANEGIAQLQFHLIHGEVEKGYTDKYAGREAKYQNQQGITLAKV
jgi:dCTP deaminase